MERSLQLLPYEEEEPMRRLILTTAFAASLGLPALSFAAPTTGRTAVDPTGGNPTVRDFEAGKVFRPHDQPANGVSAGSLGGGMVGGNEPGHVESPGTTKIDNDSRGPINDVQVGRGTNDTPQSKKPKPVY